MVARRVRPIYVGYLLLVLFAGLALAELVARKTADFEILPDGAVTKLNLEEDGGIEHMIRRFQVEGVDMWEFRDDRPGLGPNPRGIRILGIGDSIMEPHQLPYEQGFFHQLVGRLAEALPEEGAQGINLSVGGYNLRQNRLVLKHKGRALAPDLILLQMWLDDRVEYRIDGDELYTTAFVEGMVTSRRAETGALRRRLNESYLFTRLELASLEVEDWGMPTIDAIAELSAIIDLAGEIDAQLMVLLFPALRAGGADSLEWPRWYDDVTAYLTSRHVRYVDMREAFVGVDIESIRMDDAHYLPKGHQRIAEFLFGELRKQPMFLHANNPPDPPRKLSLHEVCRAVEAGTPGACRMIEHHQGRTGDCLFLVALKSAQRGADDPCGINENPFMRQLCAMVVDGQMQCQVLVDGMAEFNESRQFFEKASVFLDACQAVTSDGITACDLARKNGPDTDVCSIARTLWSHVQKNPEICETLDERRSREMCLASHAGDTPACTEWIGYDQPLDPAWWQPHQAPTP